MQHDKQERLICGAIASQTVVLAIFGGKTINPWK